MLKKGDRVVAIGSLKEVVDFLASADDEKLRLLKSFLSGGTPIEDAKKLGKPLKVGKIYKDTLEVTLSKDYVWEEHKDYFVRAPDELQRTSRRRNTPKGTNLESGSTLRVSDSRADESVATKDS